MDFLGIEPPPPELQLDPDTTVFYGGDAPLGQGATSMVYPCLLRRNCDGEITVNRAVLRMAVVRSREDRVFIEKEMEVWDGIPEHSNVVGLIGQAQHPPTRRPPFSFLSITERLDGDLDRVIFRDKDFADYCNFADILQILTDICSGLVHLHDNNIVHLDLKPANVLVSKRVDDYMVKLADFGASRTLDLEHTSITATREGTLPYMAPEVLSAPLFRDKNVRYKRAVDVYSFGVMMWVLINRSKVNDFDFKRPEMGREITWGALMEAKSVWCAAPPELCDLIESCLRFHDGESGSSTYGRPTTKTVLETLQSLSERPWVDQRVPRYIQDEGGVDATQTLTMEDLKLQVEDLRGQVQDQRSQMDDARIQIKEQRAQIEDQRRRIDESRRQIQDQRAEIQELKTGRKEPDVLQRATKVLEFAPQQGPASTSLSQHQTPSGPPPVSSHPPPQPAAPTPVRVASKKDNKALLNAAKLGRLNDVKELLAKGADIETRSFMQNTPLYMAAEYDHPDVVEYLIGANADLNGADNTGYTPLMVAAYAGRHDSAVALIRGGANLDIQNRNGATALYEATEHNFFSVVKELVDAGANVNIPKRSGRTPLYKACYYGHKAIVEVLIAAGADVNLADNEGKTPMEVISTYAFADNSTRGPIQAILQAAGAKWG